MSVEPEPLGQPNGAAGVSVYAAPHAGPTTPLDVDNMPPVSSQVTLPSTESPESPIDDANASFKTELNDDHTNGVIPSSLTPPPSSQVPTHGANGALQQPGYVGSQRSTLFSPPATGMSVTHRDASTSDYVPPTPRHILEASADELRAMMQNSIQENSRLKMETAHYKLQYNLLSLQADEDAKRAAVEHEMTRREVDALRATEHQRQARRELSAASDSAQTKYLHMKMNYEAALDENEVLSKRLKMAKKIISQKEEDIASLKEERDMLLTRIRENREHFHMLCSPGGMFHTAMTPKQTTASTPQQQHRSTPRQTPKAAPREARLAGDQGLDALLQALSQDNNSAPSTPLAPGRSQPRHSSSKHTRNAQSMSSLPTTPINRLRLEGGLLPSADLVPQTEPPRNYASMYAQQRYPGGKRQISPAPPPRYSHSHHRSSGRKSRESTISAEDNEELARQALEHVAAAAAHESMRSRARETAAEEEGDEEEVFASQASQAASEMLRRDPRESFEVASSVGSRDPTPVPGPAERSATLQAKLFASGLGRTGGKMGVDKRKASGAPVADYRREERERERERDRGRDRSRDRDREPDHAGSPIKKARVGSLGDRASSVGLGIVHGR